MISGYPSGYNTLVVEQRDKWQKSALSAIQNGNLQQANMSLNKFQEYYQECINEWHRLTHELSMENQVTKDHFKKTCDAYTKLYEKSQELNKKIEVLSHNPECNIGDIDEVLEEYDAHLHEMESVLSIVEQEQAEVARLSTIHYRDLQELESDARYLEVATIADGAVRRFMKEIIRKDLEIDNLLNHEINVFAMAYESFVKMNGMQTDPQWKTHMGIAITDRYGDIS